MRWLKPGASRRDREKGAVTTIVAVLLASGVVMGMLALTVDVGNIMAERRQLQNGSDAAALALARSCAKSPVGTDCSSAANASSGLASLAGANSKDNLQSVPALDAASQPLICGHNVPTLPTCTLPSSASDLAACVPTPSWLDSSTPYVETRATTLSSGSNPNALTSFFARAVVDGYVDKQYRACSRAAWGPAGATGTTLPLVMGYCDWQSKTADGTKFAPAPPYTPAPGTSTTTLPSAISSGDYPILIVAHAGSDDTVDTCGRNANGGFYPGGFGWTETDATVCSTSFDDEGNADGDPGASLPGTCKDQLAGYVGREVYIPVAIEASGTGSGGTYTVDGVASFFFAGYAQMASADPKNKAVYKEPTGLCTGKCNGSTSYIWGWFTTGIVPTSTTIGTGTPRGGTAVVPVG